jgi:hypothetical protein
MKVEIPLQNQSSSSKSKANNKYFFSWDDLPYYILSNSITPEHIEYITIDEPNWEEIESRLDTPIGRRILIIGSNYNRITVQYITKRISSTEWEHYIVIFNDRECSPYLYHFTLYDMLYISGR